MAVLTFDNINVQDLNEGWLEKNIRAHVRSGNVSISVVVADVEQAVDVALDGLLKDHPEAPFLVDFEPDFDFAALAEKVEADDAFDVSSVFEQRKITNPYHHAAAR